MALGCRQPVHPGALVHTPEQLELFPSKLSKPELEKQTNIKIALIMENPEVIPSITELVAFHEAHWYIVI